MWYLLRDRRLEGYKFRRQMAIGAYIVDFVCLSARLIVGLDGGQHADRIDHDLTRDAWLRSQRFDVIRFWNNDVLTNMEGVLQQVLERCATAPPHPYPSPARGEGNLGRIAPDEEVHKETQRRLRWRCRRGLLELDVWLGKFSETGLSKLTAEERVLLEALLEEADMNLLDWLESRQTPPPAYAGLLEKICASV